MDAWVGSGVDELTMINEKSVKIRLPSDDVSFILENVSAASNQMPSLGEYMNWPAEVDIDLPGQFILLLRLRKRVLRYVQGVELDVKLSFLATFGTLTPCCSQTRQALRRNTAALDGAVRVLHSIRRPRLVAASTS